MSEMIGTPLGEKIVHHEPSHQTDKEHVESEAQLFKSQMKEKQKKSKWKKVLRVIANIFVPLIPAFVGAG
ncbi:PTS N-acetylmuramic acid transporter subunit IIBC, partial [Klebsiella pneumoniae]|nr:PTS N-acetylmuramic acid transporter subunit IIBC [Klebsiella pneumoniae]